MKDVIQSCTPGEPDNIFTQIKVLRAFGGGKSGAFVYEVEPTSGWSSEPIYGVERGKKYILKVYAGAYKDSQIHDHRPFREVYALCKLSKLVSSGREDGFTRIYKYGCVEPRYWAEGGVAVPKNIRNYGECLYVLMDKAPGAPLMDIDVNRLNNEQRLGILLRLLSLLQTLRKVFGDMFEHVDFHPDNIMIDLGKCSERSFTVTGREGTKRYVVKCPYITIIDFDLVQSNKFEQEYLRAHTVRHTTNLRNFIMEVPKRQLGVPERTFTWVLKWMGMINTGKLLDLIKSLRIRNSDINNWLAIAVTLTATARDRKRVNTCSDAISCVVNNPQLFAEFLEPRGTRPPPTGHLRPIDLSAGEPFDITTYIPIKLLDSNIYGQVFKSWEQLNRKVYEKHHHYVDLDRLVLSYTMVLRGAAGRHGIVIVREKREGAPSIPIVTMGPMGNMRIDIGLKPSGNYVNLVFERGLMLDVNLRYVTSALAGAVVGSLGGLLGGGTREDNVFVRILKGMSNYFVKDVMKTIKKLTVDEPPHTEFVRHNLNIQNIKIYLDKEPNAPPGLQDYVVVELYFNANDSRALSGILATAYRADAIQWNGKRNLYVYKHRVPMGDDVHACQQWFKKPKEEMMKKCSAEIAKIWVSLLGVVGATLIATYGNDLANSFQAKLILHDGDQTVLVRDYPYKNLGVTDFINKGQAYILVEKLIRGIIEGAIGFMEVTGAISNYMQGNVNMADAYVDRYIRREVSKRLERRVKSADEMLRVVERENAKLEDYKAQLRDAMDRFPELKEKIGERDMKIIRSDNVLEKAKRTNDASGKRLTLDKEHLEGIEDIIREQEQPIVMLLEAIKEESPRYAEAISYAGFPSPASSHGSGSSVSLVSRPDLESIEGRGRDVAGRAVALVPEAHRHAVEGAMGRFSFNPSDIHASTIRENIFNENIRKSKVQKMQEHKDRFKKMGQEKFSPMRSGLEKRRDASIAAARNARLAARRKTMPPARGDAEMGSSLAAASPTAGSSPMAGRRMTRSQAARALKATTRKFEGKQGGRAKRRGTIGSARW